MKVHIRQIPQGETLHLEGEDDPSGLELQEAGATPVSPLSYSLDVGLSEGGLFATGRVSVRVRMRCVACLEDLELDIVADPFSLQTELTGREQLDLTPFVREDIHLLLPPHPRCDSGGTCPAGALRTSPQQPEMGASAWDALDKLKT
ncbi:MAG: hypothetical protein WCH98_08100 [Verrucomicrobiota bacterium]